MTTQEIYTAGLSLTRQLATLTRNQMNEDPSFNMAEWDALRNRVAKFFQWAIANDKKMDLRYFLNTQKNRQTDGEWDAMLNDIENFNNVTVY